MSNKQWRTSYVNHLLKFVKGEEPSAFAMTQHYSQGKGHTLEYLTEYALSSGGVPGRKRTWSNLPQNRRSPFCDYQN